MLRCRDVVHLFVGHYTSAVSFRGRCRSQVVQFAACARRVRTPVAELKARMLAVRRNGDVPQAEASAEAVNGVGRKLLKQIAGQFKTQADSLPNDYFSVPEVRKSLIFS